MPNLGIQFCALVLPGKKIERLNCCLPSIVASFIRSQTLLFLGILEEHHSTSCSASGTCDLSWMHIFPLSGIYPPWQIETSRVEMHNLITIQQSHHSPQLKFCHKIREKENIGERCHHWEKVHVAVCDFQQWLPVRLIGWVRFAPSR